MSLETIDLENVKKEIKKATKYEFPKIEKLRAIVRNLSINELNYRQCHAIAPVATDGGENKLYFEPISIDIIRVVDSEGKEHVQKIIPISADYEVYKNLFYETPILKKFLDRLSISYDDVSYMLPNKDDKDVEESKVAQYVGVFREILEWAVLLEMAWNPGPSKVLLMRDGLLRTAKFKPNTVSRLADSFEQAHKENNSMLIGVAKHSKVLNYLSLALNIEETFMNDYPCFCEVPLEIEKSSYPWYNNWVSNKRIFGKMHLVKFSPKPDGVVFPVDIPPWLMGKRKEVLEYAAETAKTSFPLIGYPYPLIKAHENAMLGGLEMEMLYDYLIKAVLEEYDGKKIEKILAYITLGKTLSRGGGNYE
ncbi:MAG: DNA double-strand break repair nuclease NurA [Candidatus Methanofastidiosum sp.]|nr:DNA double-strand break repair nuclease NurA [Methanofastidiosum sp.]